MSAERLPAGRAVTPAASRGCRDGSAGYREAFFVGVSAVFHYLGPSLAVLLFARLDVLRGGVAPGGQRGRGVRALAAAMATRLVAGLGQPPHAAGPGRGTGRDEPGVLPCGGPAAAVHGRRDRVPGHRDPGRRRGADPAQRRERPSSSPRRVWPPSRRSALPGIRSASSSPSRTARCSCCTSCSATGSPTRAAPAGSTAWGRPCSSRVVVATPWGLGGALPAFGHPALLLAGAGVGGARRWCPRRRPAWPWPGCPGPRSP